MKNVVRAVVAVALVSVFFLYVSPARSEQVVAPLGATGGTTSSFLIPTLTLGTTGAIIYLVIRKPEADGGLNNFNTDGGGYVMNRSDALPFAQAYLKDNGAELVANIGQGMGPRLNELEVALSVPQAHRADFARMMYDHRDELAQIASGQTLTQDRAARFFERIGDFMASHPVLSADLSALRARAG